MAYLIDRFNRVLTGGFDILFLPLGGLAPLPALTILSVLVGLLMVWVFGKVSNQDTVRRTRERIHGNLIGVLLFRNNVGVFLRIQGRILGLVLNYLGLSVKPMLVMIVPLLLLLVQLSGHFALRPLAVGGSAVVTVGVRDGELLRGDPAAVRIETGTGVVIETPPARIPAEREVSWRVRAEASGMHVLTVHVGDSRACKSVVVGDSTAFLSKRRTGGGPADRLLHPAEPSLRADSPVTSISVGYPPLDMSFLGWRVNWLLWFVILSIVSGYLLKRPLGVEV